MNTGVPRPEVDQPGTRVLGIQTKLHQWAGKDPDRRFDDLFNLVTDPAFLRRAWRRVRDNTGSRSKGVDGMTAYDIEQRIGVDVFLERIREELRAGMFRPLPVRERGIPKAGGKRRRLGIPTVTDRVVQAALKLVLEPIFEADFRPCSYGFRPRRRAQDAIAEIQHLSTRSYEWVLDADIEACFDSIDHVALMGRVRRRIKDKRVLALVKAFLKAGILTELGASGKTDAGTPQGGILSPLLANIALSVLDEHANAIWDTQMRTESQRQWRRKKGQATWRIVRYADDFVVLVSGAREHAEQMRDEIARVTAKMGLQLSPDKTRVVHIDEGFDFLGFRIQRHRKRGTQQRYVYTFPSKKAFTTAKAKVRRLTQTSAPNLRVLLVRVNHLLRGWCNYFRHGVSKRAFNYLRAFTWRRVAYWIRKRHKGLTWKTIRRRFMNNGWVIAEGKVFLFNPASVPVTRYRYRGQRIPTPWPVVHAA